MATYTYLLGPLLGNTVTAELPLTNVSFSRVLNGAGTFRGSLGLGDAKIAGLDPRGSSQPSRMAVYVDRGGVLVWGGVVWGRRYRHSQRMLELQGLEFWSYFRRRLITTTAIFASQDQLAIARSLITTAAAVSGGDIGVTLDATLSGVNRDRTYFGYELKPVAEAIEQLSAVLGGFDFGIDVQYVNGVPAKTLNLSYPRRGATVDTSGLMFELPGNITDYSYAEDGTLQETTSYAIGSGTENAMLLSHASSSQLLDAGYPVLEATHSFKDVTVQSTLDNHALAENTARQYAVALPELWIRSADDPVLGSYTVGDDVRVRITDEWFNLGRASDGSFLGPGLDTSYRILSYDVTPGEDSQSEGVHLVLGQTG